MKLHVVKGRQYSAYTVQFRMLAPQSQKWSLRPTVDLDSDDIGMNSTASELQISRSWHAAIRAIYSTRPLWDYVSQENI
jgi:hypothetical protein